MAHDILIADDHQLFREGLIRILQREPDLKVVGEATNGREAVKRVAELKPEIVIMDISMPQLNGIQATAQLIHDHPDLVVIALSMHSDRQYVAGMLKAGAKAYLLKDCAGDELVKAIHEVLNDRLFISPDIAGVVLQDYLEHLKESNDPGSELSEREREVLQLIAEGQSTRNIAATLFISVKTVETHRAKIMDKLNLRTIPELTKYAIRTGLTSLE